MENLLQRLFLAGTIGLTGLGLSGCGFNEEHNVILSKGKIENVEFRVLNNIQKNHLDTYSIEVYDSKGNIKAEFNCGTLLPKGFIRYDNDHNQITLRNNSVVENPADYKAEK